MVAINAWKTHFISDDLFSAAFLTDGNKDTECCLAWHAFVCWYWYIIYFFFGNGGERVGQTMDIEHGESIDIWNSFVLSYAFCNRFILNILTGRNKFGFVDVRLKHCGIAQNMLFFFLFHRLIRRIIIFLKKSSDFLFGFYFYSQLAKKYARYMKNLLLEHCETTVVHILLV